jgi:hypothetical protein
MRIDPERAIDAVLQLMLYDTSYHVRRETAGKLVALYRQGAVAESVRTKILAKRVVIAGRHEDSSYSSDCSTSHTDEGGIGVNF